MTISSTPNLRSVHPSVRPSVCWSVRNPFFFTFAQKRMFLTFEIARGWQGEGIESDEGSGKGAREGMTSEGTTREGMTMGDASDGRVSGLVIKNAFWRPRQKNIALFFCVARQKKELNKKVYAVQSRLSLRQFFRYNPHNLLSS